MDEILNNKTISSTDDIIEPNSSLLFKFIFLKKYRVIRHVFYWFAMYYNDIFGMFYTGGITFWIAFILGSCIVFHACTAIFVIYILLPKFFFKNKYGLFILYCFLLETVYTCYSWYIGQDRLNYFQFDNDFILFFIRFVIQHFVMLGGAIAIKLFKYWYFDQIRLKKAEKEKYNVELQYLKNQINPHFLFNSLNNVLVMHKIGHPETEKSILGLSDLLKYQLYDCSHDKVPLRKEIEYMENYIKLERIRKTNLELNFKINERDTLKNKLIEPLLFTPFIENAFKHARTNTEKLYIDIELTIEKDYLSFVVKNSKRKGYKPVRVGGIGINNVKRRLELVYEDKHDFHITETDDEYKVELGILLLNFDIYINK